MPDPSDGLRIRGARQHNLSDVDLDLPLRRLVVFCGPSGSGKSSLAFDTIFAEGQRRYLAALGMAGRARLPPPDADELRGLPPTLALRQRHDAPPSHATLADVADVLTTVQLLFGRFGVMHCPRCDRAVQPVAADTIVDRIMEGPEGSRVLIEAPLPEAPGVVDEVRRAGFARVRYRGEVWRLDDVPPDATALRVVVDRVKLAADRRARVADSVRLAARAGLGVVVAVSDEGEQVWVERPYCVHDDLPLPKLEPRLLSRWSATGRCASCAGAGCEACAETGLSETARRVRWRGQTLEEVLGLGAESAARNLMEGEGAEEGPVDQLRRRLDALVGLGLGGPRLATPAPSLSAGQLQRARLTRVVTAALGGVAVVLDEPAAGLDDDSAARVVEQLRAVIDEGSSVLAVSHHPVVIRAADHLVEFGPGAGVLGGCVVFDGPAQGIDEADTATGRWLSGRLPVPGGRHRPLVRWVEEGGRRLPLGALSVVVGPSGSGKSTWLERLGAAAAVADLRVVAADRAAGRSRRSMVATYVGLWDVVRKLLAQTRAAAIRGLEASAFSLNVKGGRCEACRGQGTQRLELELLPDVEVPCEVCGGARFARDVLDVRWKGVSPAELLAGDADTLRPILAGHPHLDRALGALVRVGLGYLPLGRTTAGLSGGEARRLALARELVRSSEGTIYLLDDVTVGLHRADVVALLPTLHDLVDGGGTVWMATHDRSLVDVADHVVEIGD